MPAVFRRFLAILLLSTLIVGGQAAHAQPPEPLQIAVGDVTQTTAVVWALTSNVGRVIFEVALDPGFRATYKLAAGEVRNPAVPVKSAFDGLEPNTRYYYRATDARRETAEGTFKTAAGPDQRVGLRFGVSGDWRGDIAPYPAIRNIPERELTVFVKLGDTIYGDVASPAFTQKQAKTLGDFRAKHREVLSGRYGLNTWRDARASTALLATIDDHEVTNDFVGGAAPSTDPRFDQSGAFINETQLYKNGLQAFVEYMPIFPRTYEGTGEALFDGKPKLYRYMTYGQDAALIILDARSFRDPALPDLTTFTPEAIADYLKATYTPNRSLLGRIQKADLKADLLRAQAAGITWKFIFVPEPIQNLGPLAASDRFEGYAAERAEILKFIAENKITNVVWVAADIHGTIVNNLYYQESADGPRVDTAMWEITTGSVGYDAPFGPTVITLGTEAGLIKPNQAELFRQLPLLGKDAIIKAVLNEQYTAFGLDPIGLQDSAIPAELIKGDYLAVNTYGWTEFEIDAATQALLVTTYGIEPYSQAELEADPAVITARQPAIVSQFRVQAVR